MIWQQTCEMYKQLSQWEGTAGVPVSFQKGGVPKNMYLTLWKGNVNVLQQADFEHQDKESELWDSSLTRSNQHWEFMRKLLHNVFACQMEKVRFLDAASVGRKQN